MEIDILLEAPEWEALDLDRLVGAACDALLAILGLDPQRFALSVLAADATRIAELNAEFRGKPTPTNVLSWPAVERAPSTPGAMPSLPDPSPDGPSEELGDIALAYGVCAAEAKAAGKPLTDHVTHLVIHGALHCLGFDHETDEDAGLMEGIETRILARLGVPDPY